MINRTNLRLAALNCWSPSHIVPPGRSVSASFFLVFLIIAAAAASAAAACMESNNNKPNKITEIVRLRQMIKKWKKLAAAPKSNAKGGIRFLKRTLSFSESASGDAAVPKGYLAVCVGEEMRRFVIPTEFLAHRAFAALLKEAEEEFGFGQEGVLRIPCGVEAFRAILEAVEKKKELRGCGCSAEAEAELGSGSHLPPKPVCR